MLDERLCDLVVAVKRPGPKRASAECLWVRREPPRLGRAARPERSDQARADWGRDRDLKLDVCRQRRGYPGGYSWTLLAVAFAQRAAPPLVPSLQATDLRVEGAGRLQSNSGEAQASYQASPSH